MTSRTSRIDDDYRGPGRHRGRALMRRCTAVATIAAVGLLVAAWSIVPADAHPHRHVHFRFHIVGDRATQFFAVQERRDALDAAARLFEARLMDNLATATAPADLELPLDPATGADTTDTIRTHFPDGLTLEQDTIHVLVGVHDHTVDPFSHGGFSVGFGLNRGVAHTVPTIAVMSFSDRPDWSFAIDAPTGAGGNDFFGVASHELAHLLSFGHQHADFIARVQMQDGRQAFFMGENARAAYQRLGGVIDTAHPGVPLDFRTPGHWAPWHDGTRDEYQAAQSGTAHPDQASAGFFRTAGGQPIRAGMQELNPSRFTELDFMALRDLGWNVANEPVPVTPPGSAAGQSVIVAINGTTKVSTPSGFTPANMQQATFNGRVYVATTDEDQNVSISVNGTSVGTGQTARGHPALAVNDGRLFMAWTGTDAEDIFDQFGHINVARVGVDPTTGAVTGIPAATHQVLGYASEHAPALAAHDGALFLAFAGLDEHLYLDFKATAGPKTEWGSVFDTGELTEHVPVLTVFNSPTPPSGLQLFVGWIGTDDGGNLARVGLIRQIQQGLQVFPVANQSLTVDGDQFGPGFDDTITIDSSGSNVRVTLNGAVSEFSPGAIANGIVINTGGGTNIVHLLATFPGVPLTINGGGTDRLTFGPNPPGGISYTPEPGALSGYGSLAVGGMLVRLTSLEFVESVAPRITAVQVDRTAIDENGVVTLSGTFADPGAFATHSLTIDWGDGSVEPAGRLVLGERSFALAHRYLDDDPTGTPSDLERITITIADDDDLTGTATPSLTVNNVVLVVTDVGTSAESSGPASEGGPVTVFGAFTDVGTRDTHTAIMDWGDGTTSTAQITESEGSGTFQAQHAFSSGGIYTVRVTVLDDDTAQATATATVFVTGVGVQEINGKRALVVVGSAGEDDVSVNAAGGQFVVHASFLSEPRSVPAAGIQLIEVVLLAGDDHATVAGNITLPAIMDGGAGNDHLSGGSGPTILIGGTGDDMLNGGGARDIVIGGLGSDRAVGGPGDDVLIAGSTAYDSGADSSKLANDAVLMALLEEWNSARPYAERVANLRAGAGPVLNGSGYSLRPGVTVLEDLFPDVLTGSAGSDWFLFDATRDRAPGKTAGELVN